MRRIVLLLAVLTLTACSSDSSKADDLRKYLADQWGFSQDYSAVKDSKISYDNGAVTMATKLYVDYTEGQEICGWVSDWLYEGSDHGTVRVLNRDGDVLSQRKHVNDVCSFG